MSEHGEDRFLQAFDAAVERVRVAVRAACHNTPAPSDRLERARRGLGAFLRWCAEEPTLARKCIVESLTAGPRVRERRDAAVREFARMIDHLRAEARGDAAPALVSEAIAGGICSAVYTRLARGEAAQLPQLLDELMDSGLGQLVDPNAR
ncbi:hypothetical protein [Conexibacter arvalis]|uniref:TetR family transcriptional regulator n=1 Tax=Conexibacter arvalis TaxID=912552 RepID=A0A840I9F5_9ACTN|nr:hypothetical protein [Conexibacter arvalis]MBB4661496.1 hypothetical protein [Conexibacter arvalis]